MPPISRYCAKPPTATLLPSSDRCARGSADRASCHGAFWGLGDDSQCRDTPSKRYVYFEGASPDYILTRFYEFQFHRVRSAAPR